MMIISWQCEGIERNEKGNIPQRRSSIRGHLQGSMEELKQQGLSFPI